jgi:crotonobetainyl-CoA:carnitine CoA-transferase CaiB-like acyl-CoA transferase
LDVAVGRCEGIGVNSWQDLPAPNTDPRGLDEWFGRSGVGPLAGIVVADLSRVLAGPYCTMLLADLGATVIKIESPEGDETRSWRPPVHAGEATYYLSVNRNKHSIVLDLNRADDVATAREIIDRADVLVENFKPRGLVRFGLDYDSVVRSNPSIIYASITGFGDAGGTGLPGYDLLVQAMSGMMDLTGSPDTDPFRSGVAVFDVITGLHTVMGVLAALNHRHNTGEGQLVKLNLLSSALSGLVNQTGAYAIGGIVPHRLGNAHPSIYPYEPFRTGDGQLVLAVGNNRQFERLCDAIGVPELPADPQFAMNHERSINRDVLRPLLVTALKARSASEWYEALSRQGVPCAPILDVAGGVRMAEKLGLDPIARTADTDMPAIRHPVEFSTTEATYDLAPPPLDASGEHIRQWLSATRTPLSEVLPLP